MPDKAESRDENQPRSALTLLERRRVEASIVGPLVRAFMERFGEEESRQVLAGVIEKLARESGRDLAELLGETGLEAFATTLDRWKAGGALEMEILEQGPENLHFNVTRCRYAEMYRELGLEDLGTTLSCLRDFELARGFNPEIELTRTQTIMQGAAFCDFRFRQAKLKSEPGAVD